MRSVIAVAVLAACAHAPSPVATATPAASPPAAAPAPTPPPAPSEDDIRKRSYAAIEAFDLGNVAALEATLSTSYVHFEGGEPSTRDSELERVKKRKPDAPHIGDRSWTKEHTYVHADDAVFIGKAHEKAAGNDVHGGYLYDGWYTLSWKREGDAWKLALWTWQRAGAVAERDVWNEMFRNSVGFNKQPNQLLVDTVKGVRPGRALDVAMGQGRNAIYLASQGWKTTGVDFSDEGIKLAREAAAQKKLSLETINADIDKFDFGIAKWDLVTMIYAGDDTAWIEKIKLGLVRGGLFVVEYFHDNDEPGKHDGSFAPGELAKLFGSGYQILRDDIVDGVPDWAMDHASLARFVAKKL